MKILFVHPNMPGQYRNLCRYAAQNKNNTVVFLTKQTNVEIPGVHKLEYKLARTPFYTTHRYVVGLEKGVLQGQEAWRVCHKLQQEEGFKPDVIVGHPGWGDCLFLKDLWPDVPMLSYLEFYYHSEGADVGFEDTVRQDERARVRVKNAVNLLNLEGCDWGLSPTHWQKSVHPKEYHHKISVLHDGIDTHNCRPDAQASITLPNGKTFRAGDEVITYVARNFEPYRGLGTFMQAAEIILRNRPNCHIIAIGSDGVSYGRQLVGGETYLGQWKQKVKLDESRIHFTGPLPYDQLIKAIQVGAAHIYLTYPFVLSWSTLEAMATGCLLIASDTQPLQEVIEDGRNGLLVDFFSPEQLAKRVDEALDNREKMQPIRDAARRTIEERYALEKMLPLHMGLITDLARGDIRPATQEKIDRLYAA
jgi:glycosyltransferase involved in cell wall biosynthesis